LGERAEEEERMFQKGKGKELERKMMWKEIEGQRGISGE
jgi:hypothetical protein